MHKRLQRHSSPGYQWKFRRNPVPSTAGWFFPSDGNRKGDSLLSKAYRPRKHSNKFGLINFFQGLVSQEASNGTALYSNYRFFPPSVVLGIIKQGFLMSAKTKGSQDTSMGDTRDHTYGLEHSLL